MEMELKALSPDQLSLFLQDHLRLFATLDDAGRERILTMTQEMIERGLPDEFILSSARTTARELAGAAEEAEHPHDLERRRFIETHALPPDERISSRRQPRSEAKAREREELSQRVKGLLREARSARQPHERKKMRRLLMGIDLAKLHRKLGQEGHDMAREIREHLLRFTDLR